MSYQTLLAKIVLSLCASCTIAAAANGQAPSAAEQAARQSIANGVALMASGDPATAMEALRPAAIAAPVPLLTQTALCLTAAAMAMDGQIRPTEAAITSLNNPVGAEAQAVWKQALPECVRQLEGIAGRLAPEKRAALFYFLGLIGPEGPDHTRNLREAVKARPDFLEANYQLALHLFGNGELPEAAVFLRRVADQRPEWAEPRSFLGMALLLSGRPELAIPEFRQALKIRPELAEAHGQLGLALYASGDYENALNECGTALRQQAGNPSHHNCIALALLEKDRPADAAAYARRATELAPSNETFTLVLAAALAANGQQGEALAAMREAAAIQPRLRTDPTRLEKGDMLRGRALTLARELLKKTAAK